MSYILDALKKSEKERQRGAVPDLHSAQDVVVQYRKRRSPWPFVIIGILLLNAGLLTGWLVSRPKGPAPAARVSTAAPAPEASAPAHRASAPAAPVQRTGPAASDSEPAAAPLPRERAAAAEPPHRATAPKTSAPEGMPSASKGQGKEQRSASLKGKEAAGKGEKESSPKAEEVAARKASSATPPPSAAGKTRPEPVQTSAAAPSKNRLYGLSELPQQVLQDLPGFSITTHLFAADPSARVVRVNSITLHEGDQLSAGLKLEQITPDGVIFSYEGFRFRVGLN